MKKSDIIIKVLLHWNKSKTEEAIREELTSTLISRSLTLDQWDQKVPGYIANALIQNIVAGPDRPLTEHLVYVIDTILKRIS